MWWYTWEQKVDIILVTGGVFDQVDRMSASWSQYFTLSRCGHREYCAGEEVRSTVTTQQAPAPPSYDMRREQCDESSSAVSTEYMNKIRKRLNEDASARSEREKRCRKVLMQQLTAHHALQVRHSLGHCWIVWLCRHCWCDSDGQTIHSKQMYLQDIIKYRKYRKTKKITHTYTHTHTHTHTHTKFIIPSTTQRARA